MRGGDKLMVSFYIHDTNVSEIKLEIQIKMQINHSFTKLENSVLPNSILSISCVFRVGSVRPERLFMIRVDIRQESTHTHTTTYNSGIRSIDD